MDFLATISKMNRHTKYGALFAHVTAYTWAFFLLVPQYSRLTKTHYKRITLEAKSNQIHYDLV